MRFRRAVAGNKITYFILMKIYPSVLIPVNLYLFGRKPLFFADPIKIRTWGVS